MTNYTVSDYLLDRINIQDTLNKLVWFVDRQEWDLLSPVFAEELVMDYTSMFGGEPTHTNGVDQAKVWKGMLDYMDSTQHVITGILVDLPQPTGDNFMQPPTEANCSCNVSVTLVRNAARGDPITQSGGYYIIKAVRSSDSTGNPWRISMFKAHLAFMKGNADVAKNPKTNVGWL
ncbi:hypothetical protein B0H13DRAFT_1959480 [Mycena leptocephala]|nr:hypothetical protein B0H13DRAFT_1959480 [Mycena leptocephala]